MWLFSVFLLVFSLAFAFIVVINEIIFIKNGIKRDQFLHAILMNVSISLLYFNVGIIEKISEELFVIMTFISYGEFLIVAYYYFFNIEYYINKKISIDENVWISHNIIRLKYNNITVEGYCSITFDEFERCKCDGDMIVVKISYSMLNKFKKCSFVKIEHTE